MLHGFRHSIGPQTNDRANSPEVFVGNFQLADHRPSIALMAMSATHSHAHVFGYSVFLFCWVVTGCFGPLVFVLFC